MGREQHWWDEPWPWLTLLVFYGLPWLWRVPDVSELLLSAVGIAVFLALYFLSYRWSGGRLLAAVAGITAVGVSIVPVGGGWTVFAFFAAMRAATARPRRLAITAIAMVGAGFALIGLAYQQPIFWWLPSLLTAMLMGIATLSREALYDQTQVLLATREEVRRLAGLAERERMARDLHDVVGRTLSLVALRADMAKRLMTSDAKAAATEVRAIADAARSGLAEVRSALAGQAGGSLAHEVRASLAALRAAGIAAEVQGDPDRTPPNAGALLAMTLREAVTNIIRHAHARRCTINLSHEEGLSRLIIADDGVGDEDLPEGAGLTGMRQRLAAAGGSLHVRAGQPGVTLTATAPA